MSTFAFRETRYGGPGGPFQQGVAVEVAVTGSGWDLSRARGGEALESAVQQLGARTGARPVLMHQVHGADTLVVTEVPDTLPDVDALVTCTPGLALVARAADCVPVALADPSAGVVGVAHAGRPGVAHGVVPAVVERMHELGAGTLTAWVGPHVCGSCYEVPASMRAEVAARVPSAWAVTSWGTPSLDLGAGVTAQLRDAGCEVVAAGGCTRESPDLPSYRRDGASSGRLGIVAWIRG